jgi:hypothetical protein
LRKLEWLDSSILGLIGNQPLTTTEIKEAVERREKLTIPWATLNDHVQKLAISQKIVRATEVGTFRSKPYFRELLRGGLLMTPEYFTSHSNGVIFAQEISKSLYKQLKEENAKKQQLIDQLLKEKFGSCSDLASENLILKHKVKMLNELLEFRIEVQTRKDQRSKLVKSD